MARKRNWLDKLIDKTTEKSEFNRYVIADDLMEAAGVPNPYKNRELRQAIAKRKDDIERGAYAFDLKANETVLEILEQNPKAVKKAYRKQVIAANCYDFIQIPNIMLWTWQDITAFIHSIGHNPDNEEVIVALIATIIFTPVCIAKGVGEICKLLFNHFVGSRILAKKIIDLDINELKDSIDIKHFEIKEKEKQAALDKEESLKGTTKVAQQIFDLVNKITANVDCNLNEELSKLKDLYTRYRASIAQDGKYVNESSYIAQVAQIEFDVNRKISEYNYKKQTLTANYKYLNSLVDIPTDSYEENLNMLANQNNAENESHLSL